MGKGKLILVALVVTSTLASCASAKDRDSNPPGPRGGPGTDWENPQGRLGGPGSSPDQRWRRAFQNTVVWVWHPGKTCWFHDPDQNPPGRRGGLGTNWENPPGPIGGAGASPDIRACQ